ncbi:MAG: hypothetical protein JEZ06_00585 [Anaerolineaceae bacterium]|nr:hypothetical protein [Anaerolineaceae bacterium]
MKNTLSKTLGILLILTALAGWAGSIYGIFRIWQYEPIASNWVLEKSAALSDALNNSESVLEVLDDFLIKVESMITTIEVSAEDISSTMETTAVLTDDLADLTGEDFPIMVSQIQSSLTSVESSAKLIDDTLKIMSILPFFKTRYEPEVPLAESIADVNKQMDRVPQMLERMQGNLALASGNLGDIQTDIDELLLSITSIQDNLEKTRIVIGNYQGMIDNAQGSLEKLQDKSPVWIHRGSWLLTIVLIWLIFVQVGLFAQGTGYLKPSA